MIRTGIFGGSFNPIHVGHIGLARQVIRQGLCDEVWLMVSPHNPLKEQADLLPEDVRLALAQKALEGEAGIEASDFEFGLARPSYTWKTLRALRRTYPERAFSLIIGADNWLVFDRWAHHAELLKRYPIIIYPREGCPLDEPLPTGVQKLEAPLFPASSTLIRQKVRAGESLCGLVPESIISEVEKLYKP